jgi:DNA invertase Pin-like site-specific DNA recombinase
MRFDPTDPMGKMFFNILATFAEFQVDLLRMRTREGMAIARERQAQRPGTKLSPARQAHLLKLHAAEEHTIAELAELFEGIPADCVPSPRTPPHEHHHRRPS